VGKGKRSKEGEDKGGRKGKRTKNKKRNINLMLCGKRRKP
jgi:hypothetical protein